MNQVDKEMRENVNTALEKEQPCIVVTFRDNLGIEPCNCGDPACRASQVMELLTRHCDAYVMANLVMAIFEQDDEVKALVAGMMMREMKPRRVVPGGTKH